MKRFFQSLLAVLAAATERQLARYVQFLEAENRMLRGRLPKRLVVTPQERQRLLKLGQPLGLAVRELILKIARETGWGYTRVLGEIRKLTTRKVSRQTVANIMRENGLDPGPKRGEMTWDEFIKMHADSLWQCDFFCKRVWTLKGLRDFYVLAFLNVGTRRVWTSICTAHPDNTWVCQQADAFCGHVRANELQADIVFHDADTKFGKDFNATLKNHGLRPRRLRPVSPNMNAFVERWIQSIEVECLDHFIVLGAKHLDYLVSQYLAYYHSDRPHQGLENRLILTSKPPPDDVPDLMQITCYERLGGLLKHFERRAA